MKTHIEDQIDDYVEALRKNMIEEAKTKGLAWVNSDDKITSIFDANLVVHRSNIIEVIRKKFGLSFEEASSLFGKSKVKIYKKYSK
nr:hypothetical protein [uncultured Draconibacterium sp.]